MINISKVISTSFNNLKQLSVKVLRKGKADVQEALQVSSYGIDSNPIKDMVAVYAKGESDSNTVIIGYILMNKIAKEGELRLFSTNKQGTEKFYYYLKDDGTTEIGGNTNWAVKYNELATEFNKLKTNFNNHLTEFNAHIHSGGTISGSTGTTTPSTQLNSSDITQAKNDKIKTIG